jgi:hypothetical protein
VLPIVAAAVFDEDHTPPLTASVSVIVLATHTLGKPEIVPAFGSGLTVIVLVAVAVPQTLV